jgi:hypothetical protein
MPDLAAVVRATQLSARALKRMQRTYRDICDAKRTGDLKAWQHYQQRYQRARADYDAAQRVLARNPLPGDVQ